MVQCLETSLNVYEVIKQKHWTLEQFLLTLLGAVSKIKGSLQNMADMDNY